MTGWRLLAALTIAFGVGWAVASWGALIRRDDAHIRMYQRLLVAEANQDHAVCQEAIDTRDAFIAHQESLLDAYRSGADLADEVEQHLQDQGGGS